METLSHFIKAFDIYGITYSFKYKNKERYQTILGGLIALLFLILVFIVVIYYFIPFSKRKNFTIVYYTMNLASTEEVNIFQSQSNIAIGLICEGNKMGKFGSYDLLDLYANYILYVKSSNGSYHKIKEKRSLHICNYDDFYNKNNDQFDYLGMSRLMCLEKKQDIIQGIYSDQIFSYYEFTVAAKNDSVLKDLDKFLWENDCKLDIYFTDIIIDIDNYKNPMTPYLNNIFIQLNPTVFIKRAMYFMNQYFTNDDYLLFVFGDDDENVEKKALYSRYEEYYLYMGFNRNETRPNNNYMNYVRMYIRADLKKTIIKRKYQKFMEFFADATSILVALYDILFFILNFFDYFYAYHHLSQNIFFFKDIKHDNKFNIFPQKMQIQEVLSSLEKREKSNNSKYFIKDNKDSKKVLIENNDLKNSRQEKELYSDFEIKDIQIYKNNNPESKYKNLKIFNNDGEEKKSGSKPTNKKILKSLNLKTVKFNNNFNENDLESEDKSQKEKISEIIRINNTDLIIKKIKNKIDKYSKESSKEKSSSSSFDTKNIDAEYISKIESSFNLFEIVVTEFLKCCVCRRLAIKSKMHENANKLLNNKLDIITYVRNMILFDIITKTILDDDRNNIINLLCRPVISLKNNQKKEFNKFYNNYKEQDFNKFANDINELLKKPKKEGRENKLISLVKGELKKFL